VRPQYKKSGMNELGVEPEEVWAKVKYRRTVEIRSLLCYWAVRKLGVPTSSLERELGISIPAISDSVSRGQRIAEPNGSCWYSGPFH